MKEFGRTKRTLPIISSETLDSNLIPHPNFSLATLGRGLQEGVNK